ncbi:MAG TPA: hypothetical protein PLL20_08130 [Phycisphaerae bacterium]|nr:hypothetical protein [Phycisphaerae bacterium]HRR84372.1 hypothetical protein [Phycisphaerae bacterium]
MKPIFIGMALLFMVSASAHADLVYTFNSDAEGFQNVSWQANAPAGWGNTPTVMQTHTVGGWQMQMTKEFSWGPGGGSANQQLAMQALANSGTAKIAFDVMVDGTSFPPASGVWYQFNAVGNSDGTQGWTQIDKLIDAWQNVGQSDLRTWHFELTFAQMGWQPGDTWFQFWTGSNSAAENPVNFYLDNVIITPEPAALTLLGLCGLVLIRQRRIG